MPDGEFVALLGPSGLRQDDDDEHDLRAWRRRRSGEIYFDDRPMSTGAARQAQRRLRLPELRDLHAHDVHENLAFGLRVRKPRPPKAEIDAGVKRVAEIVGVERDARPQGRPPVRQRHAEGRARALDDRRAGDLPARRAVLEPRRGVPRLHARRAQAHPARDRPDDGLRHPRPGRGDGHGGPDRRS